VGSNHDAQPVNFGLAVFDGSHVGFYWGLGLISILDLGLLARYYPKQK